jgi:cytochrome c
VKTSYKAAILFLLVLVIARPHQKTIAQQGLASPTPTYDPLAEPPLPPNPTEYELGRNLYWHWCMTCHGDRGQGLTDEFRGIWEPEHQNCWGRGCHAGRPGDGGFPIPTVVPALVDTNHLERFASLRELADFLKATHPPQSPGSLKDDEYHAIARFVFMANRRSLSDIPATSTPVPTSTQTLSTNEDPISTFSLMNVMIVLIVLGTIILTFIIWRAYARR